MDPQSFAQVKSDVSLAGESGGRTGGKSRLKAGLQPGLAAPQKRMDSRTRRYSYLTASQAKKRPSGSTSSQ